jgi:pimeloyl-ACP methyl ester carboxylesterase
MGTSTGGTQALQLAATYPNDVAAIILYSPNIEINDPNAFLLNNPWGLQIARLVKGGKLNYPADTRPIYSAYWNRPYRLEAVVNLQEMLETTMTEQTFKAVKQPVLLLYYYQDEQHQDNVVRVGAMKKMFGALSTPSNMKEEMAITNAGHHVLGSPILSKDIMTVEKETIRFLNEKVALKSKQ